VARDSAVAAERLEGAVTSFGGTLRALSRSSSDSRCSMISVGMDDEARPTFGSVPNMRCALSQHDQ